MKTIIKSLLAVIVACVVCSSCANEPKKPNTNAIWLWGSHMKEAPIQEWAEKGFGHILLNEAAFDKWGEEAVYAFMDECEKIGLTVHVWFQAFYFEGKWVSPIDDEKRAIKQDFYDMVIDRAKGYVEKGVKGIHLDYIRYPDRPSSYSDAALYRKYGKGNSLADWRRGNITRIVRKIYEQVKSLKPWVRVSVAPLGKHDDLSSYSSYGWNARNTVFQDIQQTATTLTQDQYSRYGITSQPFVDQPNFLEKVSINIPIDSEIKEGDIILTSGLGGMYPQEIRIGEVVSVEVDSVGIMKKAIVKPYVDFNKLEELFVVVPKEEINIGE